MPCNCHRPSSRSGCCGTSCEIAPNQILLSVFVATFGYAAAALYTVGLAVGTRTEDFPRLAVSGALLLMFASLAMVVDFAAHLAHSIQVDAIGIRVEHDTLVVIHGRMGVVEETASVFNHALVASIRIGFERTQEQDAAFGIR